MIAAVVIPTFALEQDPHRLRAAQLVSEHLQGLGYPLLPTSGKSPAECRNRGALAAAALSPTPDVIVFNDADTIVDLEQIRAGASLAADEPGLVFNFDWYRRLSRRASEKLSHPSDAWCAVSEQLFQEPPSHGCVAISAECFREAGGYDERLEAFEDIAFTAVCEYLWPYRRVEGPAVHLWHPRVGDAGEPAWEERFAESRRIWEANYPSVVSHG